MKNEAKAVISAKIVAHVILCHQEIVEIVNILVRGKKSTKHLNILEEIQPNG